MKHISLETAQALKGVKKCNCGEKVSPNATPSIKKKIIMYLISGSLVFTAFYFLDSANSPECEWTVQPKSVCSSSGILLREIIKISTSSCNESNKPPEAIACGDIDEDGKYIWNSQCDCNNFNLYHEQL